MIQPNNTYLVETGSLKMKKGLKEISDLFFAERARFELAVP